MASPPLKRIYFDSNALRHWPHLPNDLCSVFGVAKWVGTVMFIPEVEGELESQFVRAVKAAHDATEQNIKQIKKLCQDVIPVDITASRPDEKDSRRAFRERSEALKSQFGISVARLPELDVRKFVDIAISRTAPFEEITSSSDKFVTGLQDTAILFSVIDHVKSADSDHRCAIISADKIFQAADTRRIMQATGKRLEIINSVKTLFDDLFDHVWAATKAAWHQEMNLVEERLNAVKDDLAD